MYIALYIFYALVQAIVTARYALHEEESPVGSVIIMTIIAPIVTVALLGCGFYEAVTWLVTYHPAKKQEQTEETK